MKIVFSIYENCIFNFQPDSDPLTNTTPNPIPKTRTTVPCTAFFRWCWASWTATWNVSARTPPALGTTTSFSSRLRCWCSSASRTTPPRRLRSRKPFFPPFNRCVRQQSPGSAPNTLTLSCDRSIGDTAPLTWLYPGGEPFSPPFNRCVREQSRTSAQNTLLVLIFPSRYCSYNLTLCWRKTLFPPFQ